MRHKVRSTSSKEFNIGDKIYYKRNDSKYWRGPGIVAGINGKQISVDHTGCNVRVHVSSMRHVTEQTVSEESIEEDSHNQETDLHDLCLDGLDDVVNDLVNNEDHELAAAVIDDLPFAVGNMSDEEDDEAELDATDQYSEDNNREITSQSSEDDGEIIAPSSEVARNSAMETNEVGEGNSDSTNKDVLIPKVKDIVRANKC